MREAESLTVAPELWVATVSAHKAQGFDYFDFLSVRELESGQCVVTVHLLDPANDRRVLIEAAWVESDLQIPSLSEVFAGARWHELEASELFGLEFVMPNGSKVEPAGSEPFIAIEPALRRDFPLAPRLDNAWPGANEPGLAPDHPRRKRKRAVPGNPPDWEVAHG